MPHCWSWKVYPIPSSVSTAMQLAPVLDAVDGAMWRGLGQGVFYSSLDSGREGGSLDGESGVVPPCVEDLVDDERTPLAGLWTPNLDGNAGNTKLH